MTTCNLILKHGKVMNSNGMVLVSDICVRDGIIDSFDGGFESEMILDVDSCYVLPGLIDLHTHGLGHESVVTSKLSDYAEMEASKGTTSFYPTIFAPPHKIAETLRRHRDETEELRLTPQIPGFRLESPYLHHAGGGQSTDTAPITQETTEMLLDAGGGHVKIWDVSPELEGTIEFIEYVTSRGVITSLAHSYASIEQTQAAVDAGLRLVTHLFDTFASPPEQWGGVYPLSLVDYLLIEDRVTCEIIGDGLHVSPMLVEKAMRCKPDGRLVFVTDSNFGAGLPPGQYTLPSNWGEAIINGPNDGVILAETGTLCGSALSPIDLFRNTIRIFGKDIATASKLCAGAPADLMGLNKGRIETGRDADLIILDDDLELLYTIVGGSIVYRKN